MPVDTSVTILESGRLGTLGNHIYPCLVSFCTFLFNTRGPRAFYRSPDNQQQTVQSEKKDNQNDRIQINACVDSVVGNTYISMLLWIFGLKEDFVKGEPYLYLFFAPSWILPLEYMAKTATRVEAFQVKSFVFEALFDSFLPYLGSTPGRFW